MNGPLPLASLLSQPLVAFIIEFDNEFEHRTPHRTTNHGSTPRGQRVPWLVSMAMWVQFMRFVPDDPILVCELQRLLNASDKRMQAWLTRMGKWWGYVAVEPVAGVSRAAGIPALATVRLTTGGRKAQAVWRTLTEEIEERWRERFGEDRMAELRNSLEAVVNGLHVELPDSLPILGYGLFTGEFTKESDVGARFTAARPVDGASRTPLPALLSKLLLAFASEFERDQKVSFAISANVLRHMGKGGVRVRDLTRLAGVSKEAVAMALNFLQKGGYAGEVYAATGSRVKMLGLTDKGVRTWDAHQRLIWTIEGSWQACFGKDIVQRLRNSLDNLVGEPAAQLSPLFRGLKPYPDGWRALVPAAEALPHYPMILHRSGFPDGS